MFCNTGADIPETKILIAPSSQIRARSRREVLEVYENSFYTLLCADFRDTVTRELLHTIRARLFGHINARVDRGFAKKTKGAKF